MQSHGIEAFRLPAAADDAADGLGPLLRAWGDKSDIALDARDIAVFGLHADECPTLAPQGWAPANQSLCVPGMWCLLYRLLSEGAGAFFFLLEQSVMLRLWL